MIDGSGPLGPPGPLLLRSLTSAVLLDGGGDLELARETRGAPIDWGGVYGQLVRLTGPWRLRIDVAGIEASLPSSRSGARVAGERFESSHRVGEVAIVQTVAPLAGLPGAVRSLRIRSEAREPTPLRVESLFAPYLLPVLVEGIRPTRFRVETRPDEIRVRHAGFALSLRATTAPSYLLLNRASWRGGRYEGPVAEVRSEHDLILAPGTETELRWSIVGGLERDLDRFASGAAPTVPDPSLEAEAIARADTLWQAATPTMRFPDAPELEQAYERARSALRRLYVSPGEGLVGLVAGYPWYAAIWCRDLAWMLPAVVWMGDFDWARRSLASTFQYQARAELPMLGGEPGELPMQFAPGPLFFYGTSDTTLYFPDLLLRLLRHSGDRTLAGQWGTCVDRIVGWGRRRLDPDTGLVRHGGEAAAIERATEGVAKVRYGIEAHDTTIWDSADRRDSAIDVQTLWHGTLRAARELQEEAGRTEDRAFLEEAARKLSETIPALYRWDEETYLADTVRKGAPVFELRPNALRAVSAGLLQPATARAMVLRAARDDLTTPWGVRTLSSRDPQYSPEAYHHGQVWTIATAWAADAAFSAGLPELGVDYLRRIGALYAAEQGGANECYRGDRAEPFDSCFLLGLSVGPFLTTLFEGLWGLRVDGRVPRLRVHPRFPAAWKAASLEGLRIGSGRVTLEYGSGRTRVHWDGPRPLEVEGPRSRAIVPSGGDAELPGP